MTILDDDGKVLYEADTLAELVEAAVGADLSLRGICLDGADMLLGRLGRLSRRCDLLEFRRSGSHRTELVGGLAERSQFRCFGLGSQPACLVSVGEFPQDFERRSAA